MKLRSSLFCLISSLFISVSNGKYLKNSVIVSNYNNEIEQLIEDETRLIDYSEEVFAKSYGSYANNFNDYIDVTGCNVEDKSLINISDYNFSYNLPSFNDVLLSRQIDYESSLDNMELINYELFKQEDEDFDRYVQMNLNGYTDLNPKLSYEHEASSSKAVSGLTSILLGVGLAQKVVTAFNTSLAVLSSALKSSLILIVGKSIAIGVAIGALIALTTIIVLYWEQITQVFDEIKEYFLEKFNKFTTIINLFFNDCLKKVEDSYRTRNEKVGDKDLEFNYCKWTDKTRIANLVAILAKNLGDIFLMIYVTKDSFYFCPIAVNLKFCVDNKTHYNGISSYTFTESLAKQLIIKAGNGCPNNISEIDEKNLKEDKLYFYHFHNCDSEGNRINKPDTLHRVHSSFGNPYVLDNNSGSLKEYEG